MRIGTELKCPYCSSERIFRKRRTHWMRLFPSKRYDCRNCRAEFIKLFGFITIKLNKGQFDLVRLNSGKNHC